MVSARVRSPPKWNLRDDLPVADDLEVIDGHVRAKRDAGTHLVLARPETKLLARAAPVDRQLEQRAVGRERPARAKGVEQEALVEPRLRVRT